MGLRVMTIFQQLCDSWQFCIFFFSSFFFRKKKNFWVLCTLWFIYLFTTNCCILLQHEPPNTFSHIMSRSSFLWVELIDVRARQDEILFTLGAYIKFNMIQPENMLAWWASFRLIQPNWKVYFCQNSLIKITGTILDFCINI